MDNSPLKRTSLGLWLTAARPKTLPAAIAPVAVGTAAAIATGGFHWPSAIAALAVAFLLQIGVNLANDYFDFKAGIDTPMRIGPLRVTQRGWIAPQKVRTAMTLTLAMAGLVGGYLSLRGGWPILLLGGMAILSALAYSGGPYPLASHALGDVWVWFFFGPVAVCGTYYVQTGGLELPVVISAASVGCLITAVLVVNNLRDIATDRAAGKRTLAVWIGRRGSVIEYSLLVAGAYLLLVVLWTIQNGSIWFLLPLMSTPLATRLGRNLKLAPKGAWLNEALAATALLALAFSLLLAAGWTLSTYLPISLMPSLFKN